MGVKVSNNAFGTLSAGINTSDTTITLDSGQGGRFPTLGAGDYFFGTIVDTSNNIEIVKVTARSSDSMTVVRGQDDTTATAFAIGDRFELRPTAALFDAIYTEAVADATPASDSITTAMLQSGSVTDAKLNSTLDLSSKNITMTPDQVGAPADLASSNFTFEDWTGDNEILFPTNRISFGAFNGSQGSTPRASQLLSWAHSGASNGDYQLRSNVNQSENTYAGIFFLTATTGGQGVSGAWWFKGNFAQASITNIWKNRRTGEDATISMTANNNQIGFKAVFSGFSSSFDWSVSLYTAVGKTNVVLANGTYIS